MRQWIRTVFTIVAVASFLPSVSATAQESDDRQAIRKLFQQEQEGWRTANGAQILLFNAKGALFNWARQ